MSYIQPCEIYRKGMKPMVYELTDKAVILICCTMLSYILKIDTGFVAAGLMAVIISMCSYVDRLPGHTEQVLVILYAVSIILYPVNVAFVPLIMYDAAVKRMRYGILSIGISYVCIVYCFAKNVWFAGEYEAYNILAAAICAACISSGSIVLGLRTSKLLEAEDRLHKLRDESMENSILYKLRNDELIERQNYEINVATLRERNRIAREIHDNVGHMLTRAILQTGALKVIVRDEDVKKQLEDIGDTLNTAMDNVRTSVHDLHDESVDMKKAVGEIISAFPGLDIELSYDMGINIGNNIKYSFIAIIKEALNNTAKHSNGNKVKINMTEHPGFYRLVISDNGTDIPDNYTGGIGLTGIAERVRQLKGNLNISTDKGFTISISVMK